MLSYALPHSPTRQRSRGHNLIHTTISNHRQPRSSAADSLWLPGDSMNRIDNIIVTKVGSNSLIRKTAQGKERLDTKAFQTISDQIIQLRKSGAYVIVVSSAAIAAGMHLTRTNKRPSNEDMHLLQRLASIGWRHILNKWDTALKDFTIGELLLTEHELSLDTKQQEALRTIHTLLQHGDIPIVNENDAISHTEISFGDNDILSAILTAAIRQSPLFGNTVKLAILSDVNGVYEDKDDPSTLIPCIKDIQRYASVAQGAGSSHGTGGMASKFRAASIVHSAGAECWITHGKTADSLINALGKTCGTHFELPHKT